MIPENVLWPIAGVTLSQAGASVTWDPENKDEYPNNFKLIIKQILLGHEAKENEFNVVEVWPEKQSSEFRAFRSQLLFIGRSNVIERSDQNSNCCA